MNKITAMTLGMVLAALLMPPRPAHAETLIAVGGIIESADCQANTLTVKAADGSLRALATTPTTAVFVDSRAADVCVLPLLLGNDATVWLSPTGDHHVAGRVYVSTTGAPLVAQPAPGYGYAAPGFGPSYYGSYFGSYFGPYFDPYENPFLYFAPYYFGTYFYPLF